MLALKIIGAIILVIVLINLIPVGVDVKYENDEAAVSAKVCGRLILVYPKPPGKEKKEKKPKKKKAEKKAEPESEKKAKPKPSIPKDFSREEITSLVKVVLKAAGRFRRKLCVDRFKFWFVSSDPDPYQTIMIYNYVNDAICSLGAAAEASLRIKKSDIRTAADFSVGEPFIEAGIALSIRIGQIIGIGLSAGIAVLRILSRHKKQLKKMQKQQLAA